MQQADYRVWRTTCSCRQQILHAASPTIRNWGVDFRGKDKACGGILSFLPRGTLIALASPLSCLLCAASTKHEIP